MIEMYAWTVAKQDQSARALMSELCQWMDKTIASLRGDDDPGCRPLLLALPPIPIMASLFLTRLRTCVVQASQALAMQRGLQHTLAEAEADARLKLSQREEAIEHLLQAYHRGYLPFNWVVKIISTFIDLDSRIVLRVLSQACMLPPVQCWKTKEQLVLNTVRTARGVPLSGVVSDDWRGRITNNSPLERAARIMLQGDAFVKAASEIQQQRFDHAVKTASDQRAAAAAQAEQSGRTAAILLEEELRNRVAAAQKASYEELKRRRAAEKAAEKAEEAARAKERMRQIALELEARRRVQAEEDGWRYSGGKLFAVEQREGVPTLEAMALVALARKAGQGSSSAAGGGGGESSSGGGGGDDGASSSTDAPPGGGAACSALPSLDEIEDARIKRAGVRNEGVAGVMMSLLLRLRAWKQNFDASRAEEERRREEAAELRRAQKRVAEQNKAAQALLEAERRNRMLSAAGLMERKFTGLAWVPQSSAESLQVWNVLSACVARVEKDATRAAGAAARAEGAAARAAEAHWRTEARLRTKREVKEAGEEAVATLLRSVVDSLILRVVYDLNTGADPRAAGVDAEYVSRMTGAMQTLEERVVACGGSTELVAGWHCREFVRRGGWSEGHRGVCLTLVILSPRDSHLVPLAPCTSRAPFA